MVASQDFKRAGATEINSLDQTIFLGDSSKSLVEVSFISYAISRACGIRRARPHA
jgi:hypothetical protein